MARREHPGRQIIENELDRFDHWPRTNKMTFNRHKCNVMHIGTKKNQTHKDSMEKTGLRSSMCEKELDVIWPNPIQALCPLNERPGNINPLQQSPRGTRCLVWSGCCSKQ